MSSNPASAQPRLGPAWRSTSQGGRGFQPPSGGGGNTNTNANGHDESIKSSNRNSFSVLDMDDGGGPGAGGGGGGSGGSGTIHSSGSGSSSKQQKEKDHGNSSPKKFTSRSEGLRSAGLGNGGFASRSVAAKEGRPSGRSLADLVSRFPSTGRSNTNPDHPSGHSHRTGFGGGSGSGGGSSSGGVGEENATTSRPSGTRDFVDDKSIIRFTREKLLSMRPRTDPSASHPAKLEIIEGLPLLSKTPLDPVCWDNFDGDEIWAQSRRDIKKTSAPGMLPRRELDPPDRRSSQRGGSTGGDDRWQRGVALPTGEAASRGRGSRLETENPDDLWDDPSLLSGAAQDFSAFGGSLDDAPKSTEDAFDLASIAKAAKEFDDEIHGNTSTGNGTKAGDLDENVDHVVNPARPLASAGTTIRSGSGDGVNVFEDFDAPRPEAVTKKADTGAAGGDEAIKAGRIDEQTPSSRLMQMIGVSQGAENTDEPEKKIATEEMNEGSVDMFGSGFLPSSIPSNPWGSPALATDNSTAPKAGEGLDLAAKLLEARQSEKNAELELMRKREEEEKRRAAMLAQQREAELQARQAAMQQKSQQQRQQGHSQVELILTERISTILENSWGRSDLMTVLQTLHGDDARVVPLLGTVDAVRALILRHPGRFALVKDPTFGTEMAVLIMNNAQWQQKQAAEDDQRRRQEEHQKMLAAEEEAKSRAKVEAEARAKAAASEPIVITNAPWYYADPQGNIQGPFGGEEMRQWLDAGYFKGDLPISQSQNGPFRALSSLFPDSTVAFQPSKSSEDEKGQIAEMKARAAAETAKAEARAIAEREAVAAAQVEATRQAELQSNQNQSAQLKMLLGLRSSGNPGEPAAVENSAPIRNEAEAQVQRKKEHKEVKPVESVEDPAPQSKPSKSKSSKKTESAPVSATTSSPAPAPAPAPAWGGAGSTKKPKRQKSMSEIQKEEAKVSARVSKQSESTGGGWANIAASGGTTAWSGTNARAAPSASAVPSSTTSAHQARAKQQMVTAAAQKQAMNQRSSTQKTLEEFGANDKIMTPALENWCKEQMRNLNGSEDLTLVAFCMTLTDPVEIKQYLTAYLGSTPNVNNFATEFINRKNGTKQQEQWETTSSSKKGRKKKGASGK